MKILQLEIKNLASLDNPDGEILDFESGVLGDSTIFSIVGKTGSGKSTLLDAICLALYNRAPRYPRKPREKNTIVIYGESEESTKSRISPTDGRNILTRGQKEGYSKLTFRANNGNIYRAEWYVKFKIKNFDNVETKLYLVTPDGEQEARWDDIPRIIGLDYEQFLNTVLIAQGAFANFLNAGEDSRFELLEKLIGCEKQYTAIVNKIKEAKLAADQDSLHYAAQSEAQQTHILDDEHLQALEGEIARLESEEQKAVAELEQVKKGLEWYNEDKRQEARIVQYRQNHADAEKALAGWKEPFDRLALHDATVKGVELYQVVKGNEHNIQEYDKTIQTINSAILAKETLLKNESQTLQTLEQGAAAAEAEQVRQQPHINAARTIKVQLTAALRTAAEKESARQAAEGNYQNAVQAVIQNRTDILSCQKAFDEASNNLSTLQSTIKSETEKKEQATRMANDAYREESQKIEGLDAAVLQQADTQSRLQQSHLQNALAILRDIVAKKATIHETQVADGKLVQRNEEIAHALGTLSIEALSKELDTLKNTHTLMTSHDWQRQRGNLVDGKACPLCGALHHPYADANAYTPVVTDLGLLIEQKQQELKAQQELHGSLHAEKSANQSQIATHAANLKSWNDELQKLQERWNYFHALYPDWPDDADTLAGMQSQVDEAVRQAKQALADYNGHLAKVAQLRKAKDEALQAESAYKSASVQQLQEAQAKWNEFQSRLKAEEAKTANLVSQQDEKQKALETSRQECDAAQGEGVRLRAALQAEIGEQDPDVYEKQLSDAKEAVQSQVRLQKEKVGGLGNDLSGLRGQVQSALQSKSKESEELQVNADLLDRWLATYNSDASHPRMLTRGDMALINAYTDNWDQVREMQRHLEEQLTSTRTTLNNEEEQHHDHQGSKPLVEESLLVARKEQLDRRSTQELVEARARLNRHTAAIEELGKLGPKIQAARQLQDDWKAIANAIGGEGKTLRKIAQCYTLRFLIAHANEEIRKFNNRYELMQVPNSLAIRVIDHDRGDDIRETTSLSGGETFIVSLGLALGLSSLSSRNISFENLFIDEGFGTLDPDTLSTVLNSLAMLQSTGGKKVGVISHTDTMSECITTQICVEKLGNSGSSRIRIRP